MPDLTVNNRNLVKAIVSLLEAETNRRVGDNYAPLRAGTSVSESLPYLVLHDMHVDRFYGPGLFAPEKNSSEEFMISTFGSNPDQVRFLREKVKEVLIGRGTNGKFIYDLVFDDHQIMGRSLGLKGKMEEEGTTFFTEDLYCFEVTSQV